MKKKLSVIVPSRNEELSLPTVIEAIVQAAAQFVSLPPAKFHFDKSPVELLVIDNDSDDATASVIDGYSSIGVRGFSCLKRKAAAARNLGASEAKGEILVFVDADTRIPENSLTAIEAHVFKNDYEAGIFRYADDDNPGIRARFWWASWNQIRRLPLAGAKAMPAFMFCTRNVFQELGPFDENRVIAEEWPILARLYVKRPQRLVYDRTITALTSSRRMEQQPFGYSRIYLKYLWAILHESGRIDGYGDEFR